MKRAFLLAALVLPGLSLPIARFANPLGAPAHHFLGYRAKRTQKTAKFVTLPGVHLADDFEDLSFDVSASGDLFIVAPTADDAALGASVHLQAYKLKTPKGSPKHIKQLRVPLVNHLGTFVVDTAKADLLLVPTATSSVGTPPPPDPTAHDVDHYKCYAVHLSKGTKLPKGLQAAVTDPFAGGPRLLNVKALKHLCLPVDKKSEGIKNPLGVLACYTVTPAKGQAKHVGPLGLLIDNQFGPLTLDVGKESELCVPSVRSIATPTPGLTTGATATVTVTPAGTATSVLPATPTPQSTTVPPDPLAIAPPVAGGVVSLPARTTSFLYTGADPIQTGVAPGTIDAKRAAVLRGKVLANGGALSGATITIVAHPEFGSTRSRADGMFDLAVNGGGPLTVRYEKAGFVPSQRQLDVPWQDFVIAPDVVMMAVDPLVTAITFGPSAPFQAAQSSLHDDTDGTRHSLLLFAPGTTASLVFANSATQAASTLHVRATEFTVGANGPATMPAGLPPQSGYTYCVELSADEAVAAGATSVTFSQPVVTYAENFLGFAVGTPVPVGFYDRRQALWVPLANGRVVKIVGVTNDLADVDTDGDGVADAGLGLTSAERQSLASVYAAGTSLWRVPITHFSPADSNWPFAIPDDAKAPGESGAGPDADEPLPDSCQSSGSIIECENQVLGQTVPIVGTPYTLNYRSDRVPGQAATRTIRLSGAAVPASLASIGLHLSVAGQSVDQIFPASPNQQTTFTWNRHDAYGRPVIGGQPLHVTIDYNYPAVYKAPGPFPDAFNRLGGVTLGANPTRQQINVSQRFTTTIGEGLTDARTIGLGGWTLDVHQLFDPTARVLHSGGGSRRRAGSLARIITPVDVGGQRVITGVAVGPDGSVYSASPKTDTVVRIAPDGTQTIIAGIGMEGFSGDGGPAPLAELGDPFGVRLGPDGSVYIAEESNHRIRKVAPNGIITTVAGNGTATNDGDGGPATNAGLFHPDGIAIGSDSTIYVVAGNFRIRRVGADGIIDTVAGTGQGGFAGDGGAATSAKISALGVAAAADGGFYIADFANDRVRRVDRNGVITTVANYTVESGHPIAVSPNADGSVFIAVSFDGAKTPRIDLLKSDGTITPAAGGGNTAIRAGIPATQADLVGVGDISSAPDGSVWVAPFTRDLSPRILHVGAAIPGFEGTPNIIASADGREIYLFDADGRHLQTLSALTGAVLFTFGYDGGGRLTTVTEKTGGTDNLTTIEHDGAGNPKAIVGPFGQRTELAVDANGFLAGITNPANEATQLVSTPTGLLTSLTDARNKTNAYDYDADGRLILDDEPGPGSQTLARVTLQTELTATRTTALARATSYRVEHLSGNVQRRTITDPDATASQSVEAIDAATTHTASASGLITDTVLGPDPRFGIESSFATSFSLELPGGPRYVASEVRTATLANPADPLSLVSSATTKTLDGRVATDAYTAATRTALTTTPAGRTETHTLDALGRLAQGQVTGFAPLTVGYDARGRIASFSIGSGPSSRNILLAYNPQGFLDTLTDPIGRTLHLTYDAAGRVATKKLPDDRIVSYGYDAAGNLTSLTPPGRPAHSFGYSDRNELILVTPPAVVGTGPTATTYDADQALATVSRPGGRVITIAYDAAGRPSMRTLATNGSTDATETLTYDTAGRIATSTGSNGVSIQLGYVGPLPASATWTGPVAGSVARTYDDSLRVATTTVDGGNLVAFAYDADGLLTGAGSLAIARDAVRGVVTGTTLGVVTTALTYDDFGEVTDYAATASSSPLFASTLTYDALGRITEKVETLLAVASTFDYTYDLAGQLTAVTKNGAPFESYTYAPNGNRTAATVQGVAVMATSDDQDRLTQYGSTTYAYDPAGDLTSQTAGGQATTYEYDALGNLLTVTRPSASVIDYVIDGRNRRIGKKVDGTLVRGWLYDDELRPAAELDGAGNVVSRFVYSDAFVPAYMVRGGVTFRILFDQIGSARLVVDTTTGAVVQQMDYDAFGNVVLDTNPGFQPFGFAGGLYDADTKLVRFGARDYDARAGRWTAKDPILFAGRDANLYRYAGNDPVNLADPAGLGLLLDIVGGYGNALLNSYTMVIPLLNLLDLVNDLFDLVDPNLLYQSVGIDPNSTAFQVSEVACTAIGGAIAAPEAIAAQRAKAAEKPLELFVDSTKQMLKQQRRLALDAVSKDLKQVLADVSRKGKGWH